MMGEEYAEENTPVVHSKRQVVLVVFIPPPRNETVTDSANKTYHEQFFDGCAELQEHNCDVTVYDFCTSCKRSF
jgi:hypothetical protein